MASQFPFVVRVYGIYIDPEQGLLVSDEYVFDQAITKFPGGGLEFGEGTLACLKREMMEEMKTEFEVGEHFYTTDFFVPSAFNSSIQVVSIYYLMKPLEKLNVSISETAFDFPAKKEGGQSFRFIDLNKIVENSFSLIIDRKVGMMIKEKYLV